MTTAEQTAYNNGFILGMASKGVIVVGGGGDGVIEIPSYNQTLYCWDNVNNQVVVLENMYGNSYYNGNFKGAWNMPVTTESSRLVVSASTNKHDISSYVKNDGTYVRLFIKANGDRPTVMIGAITLYFEDGWNGTIQQAVNDKRVDPIAFRYASMPSPANTWDTSLLFIGGDTDIKSNPYVFIYIKPLLPHILTHFKFFSSQNFNYVTDGLYVYQTDITKVGTTPESVTPS